MTRSVYSPQYRLLRTLLIKQRSKAGLTQTELAKKLNVNQTYVSKYELGERRLDIVEFFEIAEAIGFDPIKFLKNWRSQI